MPRNHSHNSVLTQRCPPNTSAEQKDPIILTPGKGGAFERVDAQFRNFISSDPSAKFPAEKGRYALYVSPGCPWVRDDNPPPSGVKIRVRSE